MENNPVTVSQIAKRVNLENADSYIDVSTLTSPEDLKNAVSKYTIFGRVTPYQKQEIIKCLKKENHTVQWLGME